jgi:heptaprenyl diphosphate synthase
MFVRTDDVPLLTEDLGRIEARLHDVAACRHGFLTEITTYLARSGGKRLRPTLSLVTAYAGTGCDAPAPDAVIESATAVELLHLGSLYHDDVMDDATTRRTVESVNARWGNLKAILAGDYLLARASEIAASLGVEVAGLLAATIARLCEGQVLELQHTYDAERTEVSYLTSIEGKTASLLATACRIGGLVGGLPRDDVDRLTRFGRGYGMAFQIVDDILDVVATDKQLGKPAGHDLVEGVYTLPVIRTLKEGGPDATRLRSVLGSPLLPDQLRQARDIVRGNGAVDDSLDTARSFAAEAADALADLGESEAVRAMRGATQHLVASVDTLAHR